jgi:NADP-dependent 3-hydroxy acid dehydrogenase YdfG
MRTGHNVTIENDVARLFPDAHSGMDKVDVLIDYAGIAGLHATLKEITNEGWRTMPQVSKTGVLERIEPKI